jgi:hypothetical protein
MSVITLSDIDAFRITDENGEIYYGGDQEWLPSGEFRSEASCGATTCANILSYHIRTKPDMQAQMPYDPNTKTAFVEFLKKVYHCVTPGRMGTMPDLFKNGAKSFAEKHGFDVDILMMKVPTLRGKRPCFGAVAEFIGDALKNESPVAFLNLANGRVANLDSYHWVTIVSVDCESGNVQIVDNGNLLTIDLKKWLLSSTLGGAFLVLQKR